MWSGGKQCAPWDLDKKERIKKGWGGGRGRGINYALIFYHVDDRYFKFNHISFTAHRLFSVLSAIVLSHNLVYINIIIVNIVIVKSATILPWHFLSVT